MGWSNMSSLDFGVVLEPFVTDLDLVHGPEEWIVETKKEEKFWCVSFVLSSCDHNAKLISVISQYPTTIFGAHPVRLSPSTGTFHATQFSTKFISPIPGTHDSVAFHLSTHPLSSLEV
jgi:hypothetical protein